MLFEAPMGKPESTPERLSSRTRWKSTRRTRRRCWAWLESAEEDFGRNAVKFAQRGARSRSRSCIEAHELLARVALEDNNEDKAVEEANKAVAISPEALDAMAILATVDWLNDKPSAPPAGQILTSSPWIDKILKINPHYGDAYETAGHFFVINRRYNEGIQYYRKALELEPDL